MSSEEPTAVWGLEAFATEYARSRGLDLEDPDELRRRLALPLPGFPEYCLRGRLAGAVEGRIVLWYDHLDTTERPFVNVAIVPAQAIEAPKGVTAPFELSRLDGWVAITERVSVAGRSVARLDGLGAEAARLAA